MSWGVRCGRRRLRRLPSAAALRRWRPSLLRSWQPHRRAGVAPDPCSGVPRRPGVKVWLDVVVLYLHCAASAHSPAGATAGSGQAAGCHLVGHVFPAAPTVSRHGLTCTCGQAQHGAGAKAEWMGEELSHSERPDLGAAKVVVAGPAPRQPWAPSPACAGPAAGSALPPSRAQPALHTTLQQEHAAAERGAGPAAARAAGQTHRNVSLAHHGTPVGSRVGESIPVGSTVGKAITLGSRVGEREVALPARQAAAG